MKKSTKLLYGVAFMLWGFIGIFSVESFFIALASLGIGWTLITLLTALVDKEEPSS